MKAFNASSTGTRRILTMLAVPMLLVVWSHPAGAMPNFPEGIQSHLGLSYTPPCTLCHATPAGGGAVVTKFGQSMIAAGLTPTASTLIPALDALAANNTDSNHDGRSDIEQLKDGSDPNTSEDFSATPEQKFGCGARMATGRAKTDSGFALVAAALALVFAKRRSKQAD